MNFIGTFVDLSSYRVGIFKVEGLAGRDSTGAPKWKVICKECGQEQVLAHAKIAPMIEAKAPNNLTCVNAECFLSRSQVEPSESFADLRKRERREAEQAARLAESEATHRQEQAAKQRAEAARLAALKDQYRFVWLHQIKTQIEESRIISFKHWQQLDPSTRRMVLEKTRTDPTLMVEGL
jgi:hypothetical protein